MKKLLFIFIGFGFVLVSNAQSNCPPNGNGGGSQRQKPKGPGNSKGVTAIGPKDPNEIIGPDGEPGKSYVSVKDRMAYTIMYENDKTASAPAKFVRITAPVQPKQDAATFQLGNFGFNNQTFAVPPSTASYYQRLDCKDSLGLLVDITAGYDQVNNVAFWEFQSIDPLTLLPPSNPLKGFLLQQDSSQQLKGHGFVTFSMKPLQTDITLDTIGARAAIVFDFNDTIPTNIASNTIDAFAPTSHLNALPGSTGNTFPLHWGGTDDHGGVGLKYYTLYTSTDGINFNILSAKTTVTDTSFTGAANTNYYFFVLATDSVGNSEQLRAGEVRFTFTGGASVPVTWLYFKGSNQGKNNSLEWATASEQNSKEFSIQRSINGLDFSSIGSVPAAGYSNSERKYNYTDFNIDRLNKPVLYYRLKQFDLDGKFKYSNIVAINDAASKLNTIIYPNPTQGIITITVGDPALVGTMAELLDINGRMLELIKIGATSQTINVSKYVNGTYFIRLNSKEVLKVLKVR